MSYEQRKKASQGKDRMLYCPTCMCDREVYSATGHRQDEMNLHCVECGFFVARIKKNRNGDWDLDLSVY